MAAHSFILLRLDGIYHIRVYKFDSWPADEDFTNEKLLLPFPSRNSKRILLYVKRG